MVQSVAAKKARSCAGRQNAQVLSRTHTSNALCAPLGMIRDPDGTIHTHALSIAGDGCVWHQEITRSVA
jgi:hypothetical protein